MNELLDNFRNAWRKPNNALVQIILINVIFFAAIRITEVVALLTGWGSLHGFLLDKLELPANLSILALQPWSLFTYFFVHHGLFHVLFNMLFLYWFGRIIQDMINHQRVISLYVLGGIGGGIAYILIYNLFPYYEKTVETSLMLGASAGVFAVVVGASVLVPNYTMYLLFLGPVRIKYIAIFYVFLSFINIAGMNAGGEIAHLGGALWGYFFIKQLNKGNDLGAWLSSLLLFLSSFFNPQPRAKTTIHHHSATKKRPHVSRRSGIKTSRKPKPSNQAPDQEEIDFILDKISQKGYESLTIEEKKKLFDASKH